MEIPADPKLPDCCFIEDCAVSIGRTVLLTNPGAASRRPEPPALSAPIRALPGAPRTLVSMLEMDSSATLDGGDVLHTERHVFVGLSSRTNAAGVEALRAALAPELPGGARSVFAIEVRTPPPCAATRLTRGQLASRVPSGAHLLWSPADFERRVEGLGMRSRRNAGAVWSDSVLGDPKRGRRWRVSTSGVAAESAAPAILLRPKLQTLTPEP